MPMIADGVMTKNVQQSIVVLWLTAVRGELGAIWTMAASLFPSQPPQGWRSKVNRWWWEVGNGKFEFEVKNACRGGTTLANDREPHIIAVHFSAAAKPSWDSHAQCSPTIVAWASLSMSWIFRRIWSSARIWIRHQDNQTRSS